MAHMNKGRRSVRDNGQRMDALRYATSLGYEPNGVNVEKAILRDVGGFVFMGVANIHLKELAKLRKHDIDIRTINLELSIGEAAKRYEKSQKLDNL